MSRNVRNKGNKDWAKFVYKITNNSRDTLLLDKSNENIL